MLFVIQKYVCKYSRSTSLASVCLLHVRFHFLIPSAVIFVMLPLTSQNYLTYSSISWPLFLISNLSVLDSRWVNFDKIVSCPSPHQPVTSYGHSEYRGVSVHILRVVYMYVFRSYRQQPPGIRTLSR